MLDMEKLVINIEKNKFDNCYIFTGLDEQLIKEQVNAIINKALEPDFLNLNMIKLDGMKFSSEAFIDACETLPFMSSKKVILVYRANFLKDGGDGEAKKNYESCREYIENTPEHCLLIFYYLLEDKREKVSGKVKKLEKSAVVVKADKLKGEKLYSKVEEKFLKQGKEINKVELKYFCENVENNMHIIDSEIDKLVNYTEGRGITRRDIDAMLPYKSENDIFDLVDFIGDKKSEKAIELMNELVYKGENLLLILSMIERQFKLLFKVKLKGGARPEVLASELRLPTFICEKLIRQSRKFKLKQLKGCIELCMKTEKTLKSSSLDKKTEMELMIIGTLIV